MREIKFRCWDTESKMMGEVSSMCFSEGKIYCVMCVADECCGIEHDDDGYIMQFTGLHDREGKEIFEGDVVKMHNSMGLFFIAEIRIVDGCSEVYILDLKQRDYLKCYTCNHAVEVIGNIYENPELIECAPECAR